MNILIVDQSTTVCRMLRNVLHRAGIENLFETTSGSHAIEMATANGISIIITGSDLGDMRGLDLAQSLRNSERHAHTQIILISAKGNPDDVLDAVNAGVTSYIIFPFDHGLLIRKVRDAIDKVRRTEARAKEKTVGTSRPYKRRQVL